MACVVAAILGVLVGEPGAGTSRVDEPVDLSQAARHAGLRDVRVAPVGCKWPEPLASSNSRAARVPTDSARPKPLRRAAHPRVSPSNKQVARCPTCCAHPARREQREDGAGSGDDDEDEGAEAPGGFFRLVVVEIGESTGLVARWEYGSAAELGAESERSRDSGERASCLGGCRGLDQTLTPD
eukprot:scaffold63904_cov63-Phaeocystis_antarctica.AAC.2